MSRYYVVAHSTVKPGRGAEFYELLAETVRIGYEAEPELINYSVGRIDGTDDEFLHIEVYASPAGFEAHLTAPHVLSFVERSADLLAKDIEILRAFPAPVSDDDKATLG
jgi:quinol monooxygenase YgiN